MDECMAVVLCPPGALYYYRRDEDRADILRPPDALYY
jgi:hypothetical protein